MKRIALTNENGAWFDADKAELYKEATYHDGRNFISKATGSQWHHEAVYVTASGKFILNCWSNYQGSQETYELVSKEHAARWFAKQSFADEDIPELFREEVRSFEVE